MPLHNVSISNAVDFFVRTVPFISGLQNASTISPFININVCGILWLAAKIDKIADQKHDHFKGMIFLWKYKDKTWSFAVIYYAAGNLVLNRACIFLPGLKWAIEVM